MRTGKKNDTFWSEIGSAFGKTGGTPPPRIPMSNPRGLSASKLIEKKPCPIRAGHQSDFSTSSHVLHII